MPKELCQPCYLPCVISDILQAEKATANLHKWTQKELVAIKHHAFDAPSFPTGLFTPTDFEALERKAQASRISFLEAFCQKEAEDRQAAQNALDRSHLLRLTTISECTPVIPQIAPTLVLLDFQKLNIRALTNITSMKIATICKRLRVLNNIEIPEDSNCKHCTSIDKLRSQIVTLHQMLIQRGPSITQHQWEDINRCCRALGGVSLERVRHCLLHILLELAIVADMGYLDWV